VLPSAVLLLLLLLLPTSGLAVPLSRFLQSYCGQYLNYYLFVSQATRSGRYDPARYEVTRVA